MSSRFNLSLNDLLADDADDRIAGQISPRGASLQTTRMARGGQAPMNVTMFNLAEILMKAPGQNSVEDVMRGQEAILLGLTGGLYGAEAKNQLPGLEHVLPKDLLAMAEGANIANQTAGGTGGGGAFGPVDQGDPSATGTYKSIGAVKPWVKAAAEEVGPRFGFKTIWGVAPRSNKSDHPIGLALDFMTNNKARVSVGPEKEQGDKSTAYMMVNAERLRIKYIIWWQRIWYPSDGQGNWMSVSDRMGDRGDPNANHYNHVHVSFKA